MYVLVICYQKKHAYGMQNESLSKILKVSILLIGTLFSKTTKLMEIMRVKFSLRP